LHPIPRPPARLPAQSVTCYASGSVFIQGSSVNQYTQELRASTKFGKNYLVFSGFGMILDGKYYAKFATRSTSTTQPSISASAPPASPFLRRTNSSSTTSGK
jgi:ribonuclease HIII